MLTEVAGSTKSIARLAENPGMTVYSVEGDNGACIAIGAGSSDAELVHVACPGAGRSWLTRSAPLYDMSVFALSSAASDPPLLFWIKGYAPATSWVEVRAGDGSLLIETPTSDGLYSRRVPPGSPGHVGAASLVGLDASRHVLWTKSIAQHLQQ